MYATFVGRYAHAIKRGEKTKILQYIIWETNDSYHREKNCCRS